MREKSNIYIIGDERKVKCKNENKCDVSVAIKKVAEEAQVSEEEVREAVKRWLNENYGK